MPLPIQQSRPKQHQSDRKSCASRCPVCPAFRCAACRRPARFARRPISGGLSWPFKSWWACWRTQSAGSRWIPIWLGLWPRSDRKR